MYAKYYNTPSDICRLSSKPGNDLKTLLKRADKLLALESRLLLAMPEQFRKGWRLASYKGGALALQCDNAAVATRLRLQQASILNMLKNEPNFRELTRITVKVQPRHHTPDIKRKARPISREAKSQLLESAEGIDDSALRSAIQRLAGASGNKGE